MPQEHRERSKGDETKKNINCSQFHPQLESQDTGSSRQPPLPTASPPASSSAQTPKESIVIIETGPNKLKRAKKKTKSREKEQTPASHEGSY